MKVVAVSSPRVFALVSLLVIPFMSFDAEGQDAARDKLVVETLIRLKRFDVSESEKLKGSVVRHLETIKGTAKYVEYASLFGIKESVPGLIDIAKANSSDTLGVSAVSAIINIAGTEPISSIIASDDSAAAASLIQALGQSTEKAAPTFLMELYKSRPRNRQILTSTAIAVTKTLSGQRFLLEQAEVGDLPSEVRFAVGNALYASLDKEISQRAQKAIALPATADAKPLPPLSTLSRMTGNATNGKELFFKKGTCAKCHKVGSEGKEVGPALGEIGSKLSTEALFTSILDPSAGVSHNYETYSLITLDGNIINGIKISDTDESVTLRNAEGIDKTIPQDDVDELLKTGVSLMPADLQRLLTAQELADVVAYLKTLLKK